MSRERARRRAERLAVAQAERAARARAVARRARRRDLRRRLVPKLPDRRTGRVGGRSRGERAAIAVLTLCALTVVWFLVDAMALRLAVIALILVALPALVVLALGRRT